MPLVFFFPPIYNPSMKCYKSKWILTSKDEVLRDMAIVVDEGKIVDIITNSQVNFEEKYVFDDINVAY